ncbi:hypothetical protein ACFS07_10970 [Undibacterium arcticum]
MMAAHTLFGIDISYGDAAAIISAVAAVYAAYYAYRQGKDDDARRQKNALPLTLLQNGAASKPLRQYPSCANA